MDINEVCRGAVYRDSEANKEHLTGEVRIIIDYSEGNIKGARYEKSGRLIPGTRKEQAQSIDTDARNRHGG